jgi:hypothetical protein
VAELPPGEGRGTAVRRGRGVARLVLVLACAGRATASPPEDAVSSLLARGGIVLADLGRATSPTSCVPRLLLAVRRRRTSRPSSPAAPPLPLAESLRDAPRVSPPIRPSSSSSGSRLRLGGSGPAAATSEEGDLAVALDSSGTGRPEPFTGLGPARPATTDLARRASGAGARPRASRRRCASARPARLALADTDAWSGLVEAGPRRGGRACGRPTRLLLDLPGRERYPADLDDAARLSTPRAWPRPRISVAAASAPRASSTRSGRSRTRRPGAP